MARNSYINGLPDSPRLCFHRKGRKLSAASKETGRVTLFCKPPNLNRFSCSTSTGGAAKIVSCFRARTVCKQVSHLHPFFLSKRSAAVNSRKASSTESVASVMSSERSMKASKEKELAAHSRFVHVHCDTSKPPKRRLGEAVKSAFGSGNAAASPMAHLLFNRSPNSWRSSSSMSRRRLRNASCASSWVPKLNSPSLGSHFTTSEGPAAGRPQKAMFAGRASTGLTDPLRRTPMRAFSASRSGGIGASMVPSWKFSSFFPRLWSMTRSPGQSCTASPASAGGRGSKQFAIIAPRSQRKQPHGADRAPAERGEEAPPPFTRCSLQ
mmetsp:Transcript_27254/g.78409  ORF Transcript_27254/g.78409 Transcript_27254/m.78409 type:complete len:324 (+) Transcript_27254:672-1643(+)